MGFTTILKLPNINPSYTQQQSGIGSIYGGGMYGSIRELVEAEVSRAVELDRMRREIEDLKAGNDAAVGTEQRLLMEFMPVIKHLVQTFGMKQMGFGAQTPTGGPAPAINGADIPDFSDMENIDDEYDYERLERALKRLKKIVPDIERALEKLAATSEQNPDMARQFLNSLHI